MVANVAKAAGMALGMIASGYGGAVVYEIYAANREEARLAQEDAKLKVTAVLAERNAEREEKTMVTLEAEVAEQRKDLDVLEKELQAAKQRVSELESLRATRLAKLNFVSSAIEEAQRRVKQLREEAVRDREAAAALDAALASAKEMKRQKELLWNPANHPLLRSALGRA